MTNKTKRKYPYVRKAYYDCFNKNRNKYFWIIDEETPWSSEWVCIMDHVWDRHKRHILLELVTKNGKLWWVDNTTSWNVP